jgi:protoporphyrinogen oxidase
MIAIIGAGLSGLSTAYHLKDTEYAVFEKEEGAGGLCRSVKRDGFTFDYTGHFLHTRHPYAEKLTEEILPEGFNRIQRRAFIYLQGRYIPYPFQAHTYSLPQDMRKECIMGFIDAQNQKKSPPENFLDWINQTFGEGMAKYFFIPYNEKFWKMNLRELTPEWTSWSIPQPTMEEVLKGAAGFRYEQMGYNPSFLYPKRGGIELFTKAFLPHMRNVTFRKPVNGISMKDKRLFFESGEEAAYSTLISTCPLPHLLGLIEDLPQDLKEAGEQLRYLSVLNLNLGIARDNISDCHWIYFPEKEFPFYRVGFFSNISYALSPPGTSSLYVEITCHPLGKRNAECACAPERASAHRCGMRNVETCSTEGGSLPIVKETIKGLIQCGILKSSDELVTALVIPIPYAYVVYDQFRKENLPAILRFLRNEGIYSIGRYGAWEYSTMEDAILQGKAVAEELSERLR